MIMDWVIDDWLELCQVYITIFAENGVICTDIHNLTNEIVARNRIYKELLLVQMWLQT